MNNIILAGYMGCGKTTVGKRIAELAKYTFADTDEMIVTQQGGGMPVREENRPLLKRLGTVVYMRVMPDTVYERIKGDTTRPLLQCGNPPERIKEMITGRTPAYEAAAKIVIDVDNLTPQEAAEEIIKRVENKA